MDKHSSRLSSSARILKEIRFNVPKSSPGLLKDFLSSSLHEDFQNEVIARIEQMRDFYEQCGSKEYLETRGGIKAMRLVISIFHDLYANSIADLESKRKEN